MGYFIFLRSGIFGKLAKSTISFLTALTIFTYSSFANTYQAPSKNASTLAVNSSLLTQEFKKRFAAKTIVLAHGAVNSYIKDHIKKMSDIGRPLRIKKAYGDNALEIDVIAIPGLLNASGQFAHVGLGRQYNRPVIYIDDRFFDNETILRHEIQEINQAELFRKNVLNITPSAMREWIKQFISVPDKTLRGRASNGRKYNTMTSREIFELFHDNAVSLDSFYEKNKGLYVDLDFLAKMHSMYGDEMFYDKNTSDDLNVSASGAKDSWIGQNVPELSGEYIVSLSMECNIPEFGNTDARNANTKGGLGAYQGDKLEGLNDIGMNGCGIQPMYSKVKTNTGLKDVDYSELIESGIIEPVLIGDNAIKIEVWDEISSGKEGNTTEMVEVYRVNRGGTWDYLLKGRVFDILYTDNRLHRYTQEIVFGKAVHALLKKVIAKDTPSELKSKLPGKPTLIHLNEAHTVVAAVRLKKDPDFKKNGIKVVYTNHTLVPAGLEFFDPATIGAHLNRMIYQIKLSKDSYDEYRSTFLAPRLRDLDSGELLVLGDAVPGRRYETILVVDYCKAAIEIADEINAVSKEHAKATEYLFKKAYLPRDGKQGFNKKVIGILNGSGKTWKAPQLRKLEEMNDIPDKNTLWDIHENNKRMLAYNEIARRTGIKLDPEKPAVWAIRRLVEYKSQFPVLRFIVPLICADRSTTFTRENLKRLWFETIPDMSGNITVDNFNRRYNKNKYGQWNLEEQAEKLLNALFPEGLKEIHGLGQQMVLGGPKYENYWAEQFTAWQSRYKGRFVYIAESDAELLKLQAIGADICITIPRPLEEACGTSDQRTALNGGVPVSINGAGPAEWMTEFNRATGKGSGFFIGSYTINTGENFIADIDKFYSEAPADVYHKLAICSELFYDDPESWKTLMHNAYIASNYNHDHTAVTANAMERRYAKEIYLPAVMSKKKGLRGKGSAAECLKTLVSHKCFGREKAFTTKWLKNIRGFSKETLRIELNELVMLGLVEVEPTGRKNVYYLAAGLESLPEEAFDKIAEIEALNLYKMPETKINSALKNVSDIIKHYRSIPRISQELLLSKRLFSEHALIDRYGDRKYEIKYDRDLLSESQISVVEEYVKLFKAYAYAPENIKLTPFSGKRRKGGSSHLIEVYSTGKDFQGKGFVDLTALEKDSVSEYRLNLVGMLNMAIAASHIPSDLMHLDAMFLEHYSPYIEIIRQQYELITGAPFLLPEARSALLNALQVIVINLPRADKVPLKDIEEYNRLARKALTAA